MGRRLFSFGGDRYFKQLCTWHRHCAALGDKHIVMPCWAGIRGRGYLGNKAHLTQAARRFLFEQLTAQFGPASEWEASNKPGRGKDRAYDKFCEQFSKVVGANSSEAVKLQIRFGMPTIGESTWEKGQAQTAVLCLAAAFEAGFIKDGGLPNLKATGRKN